jgi:anthranilate synthase component 2
MRLLILDNHDSFTYNLVQLVEQCGCHDIIVNKTSEFDYSTFFDAVIISPGPGLPEESPDLMQFISHYHRTKKILGICLGHQAIAGFFGARLKRLEVPAHGIASEIKCESGDMLFAGVPNYFEAGRYHSWLVEADNLPACLSVIATSNRHEIMGIRHREYDIAGLQFHPESIITDYGKRIISNFCLSVFSGKP